ncbi:YcbK family protein [Paracoccus sp. R86501]|uniref:YcbK family protein n=1 Tax=Paracoccus sp. R86501 TaxID=3101711 RepID=UPI00366F9EE5
MSEQANPHRRAFLAGILSCTASLAVTPAFANMLRMSSGRLNMQSSRTGERIDIRFRSATGYDGDALRAIDRFLRDWRTGESMPYDIRTIEVLSAIHNQLGTRDPYQLTSGFRSQSTNLMLRSRGIGAAKNSFHLRAQAVDIVQPGVAVEQDRRRGQDLRRGRHRLLSAQRLRPRRLRPAAGMAGMNPFKAHSCLAAREDWRPMQGPS